MVSLSVIPIHHQTIMVGSASHDAVILDADVRHRASPVRPVCTPSAVIAIQFPYVVERTCTIRSARLHQNAGFSLYIPDCEARRQTGPKVRQAHRHRRSAKDRSGRQALPGGAVPMRLRTTRHPARQLPDLGRCPVVRMLTRPAQIRAEALPGLRRARHDPARPPNLLPRVRIRTGPGRPAGRHPVL